MPATPARDRDPHLFTLLMAGAVCSQARNHPWRLARVGTLLLWHRYDCPLIRIIVFGLLAAIPIGLRYGRFADGFVAFWLFAWLAFEGWRQWRRAMA